MFTGCPDFPNAGSPAVLCTEETRNQQICAALRFLYFKILFFMFYFPILKAAEAAWHLGCLTQQWEKTECLEDEEYKTPSTFF